MNWGEIQAMVGIGEKTESCASTITTEQRQPGSTIKPLTTYGLALESDLIHWGSIYKDEPIEVEGRHGRPIQRGQFCHVYQPQELKIYEALENPQHCTGSTLSGSDTAERFRLCHLQNASGSV
ncbi:MAG: penicillin-binding transpeptidase domain-containing protein [Ruminococcus callidus]